MTKVSITILEGPKQLFRLEGKSDIDDMPAKVLYEIVDLEQKLEKLTGYRFHINTDLAHKSEG